MRQNKNSRGKITRRKYTKTITINNGVARDANQKVTKTFIIANQPNNKKRTLAEMVYESLHTSHYFAYMNSFAKK